VASFDKVIPSGQEGKVNLSVKTKNMRGKFTKSATIRSNDPQHPSYRIKLKGTIKSYITVQPSPRAYLTGFEGDTLSQKLTISTNEAEPLTITNITSTLDDKITYEMLLVGLPSLPAVRTNLNLTYRSESISRMN
jgi:hypothetical protein